jgi:hypothetical protein
MARLSSNTFHIKHRGALIGQALIFLVFGISCIVQGFMRLGIQTDKIWNAWWFFALLSIGFLYLTIEAVYKIFFNRIILTAEEFIQYDFLKTIRIRWEQVKKVGEIDLKERKRIDFGVILKDSSIEKPNLLSTPFISLTPYFTSWNESPIKQWFKEHKPALLK